jgi:hypothetical protein
MNLQRGWAIVVIHLKQQINCGKGHIFFLSRCRRLNLDGRAKGLPKIEQLMW